MGALTDRLDAGTATVWLDSTDYAAALLNKGVVPWLDVGEFVSLQRRAQGLLKSDIVSLHLAAACAAWLDAHADLRTAMGAKSRAVFALKTLLADEALRAHLLELANGLRASMTGAIFALVLPSPRTWIAMAYAQAHGEAVESGDEEADSAAVYLADFLRGFAATGIDALLLEEAPGYLPPNAESVMLYQAVLNVADNYRWDVGLKVDGAIGEATACAADYAIAAQPPVSPRCGVALDAGFWSADTAAPPTKFRYATIPAAAKPETVLARLAMLR